MHGLHWHLDRGSGGGSDRITIPYLGCPRGGVYRALGDRRRGGYKYTRPRDEVVWEIIEQGAQFTVCQGMGGEGDSAGVGDFITVCHGRACRYGNAGFGSASEGIRSYRFH